MAARRERHRDDRDFDTTQLRANYHGHRLNRDYSAHFWRWSFARRFITVKDHVLEVGCGVDRPLSKILIGSATPYFNTYVGVDMNKLKPSSNRRLTFIGEFNFVGRWKELKKQRPEGFDVIVHYEVIEHMMVEHGVKLLKACLELLKPNGVMLMSTPCYDGKRHAANHIHEYTVPELQKAVEKAGFTMVKRYGTFMDVKHIKKGDGLSPDIKAAVAKVANALGEYFDRDALSCFFAPLFPDHSRNNLWVCKKKGD